MKRNVKIIPVKLKDVEFIKKGDLLCVKTEIENPIGGENIKVGNFQLSMLNTKKINMPNYDVYDLIFVDLAELIDYDSQANQKVELYEYMFDITRMEAGHVSHIGARHSFVGTLQFPAHKNLHFNRHMSFDCRRVYASYVEKLNIYKISIEFVSDWCRTKFDECEVENVMKINYSKHIYTEIEDDSNEPWNFKTDCERL